MNCDSRGTDWQKLCNFARKYKMFKTNKQKEIKNYVNKTIRKR